MGASALTVRHPYDGRDLDFAALRDDLAARLGKRVELLTGEPTADEPEGVLIVEDDDAGEWLDVDPALVADAVARYPAPPSNEAQFLAEFDAIRTPPSQHALVIRDYIARKVEAEARVRANRARTQAAIQTAAARREGRR